MSIAPSEHSNSPAVLAAYNDRLTVSGPKNTDIFHSNGNISSKLGK